MGRDYAATSHSFLRRSPARGTRRRPSFPSLVTLSILLPTYPTRTILHMLPLSSDFPCSRPTLTPSPQMPSEPPYTALLSAPGGAFSGGGLVRDDFVVAARPVYMRIAEHHSLHPHTPVPPPPPDSTAGEGGVRAGWLPRAPPPRSKSASAARRSRPAPRRGRSRRSLGTRTRPWGGVLRWTRARAGRGGRSGCSCMRACRRGAWVGERGGGPWGGVSGVCKGGGEAAVGEGRGAADVEVEVSRPSDESSSSSQERSAASSSQSQDRTPSKSSFSAGTDARTSLSRDRTPSSGPYSSSLDSWPEWEAPAWAGHRFADDGGWEGACDGVQDVSFTGEVRFFSILCATSRVLGLSYHFTHCSSFVNLRSPVRFLSRLGPFSCPFVPSFAPVSTFLFFR
ncbi:hypothetical protein B0H17DRAFT_676326 [Mycena rosella]|uniref:Uncharacterized protein n=1 Tax=Mycena rosella TaxID=1033263 RepID=A0AAD7GCG3_MYCRO|nr:hypothetical protein B0H17DRAFT_676326 [Mycena rosella]